MADRPGTDPRTAGSRVDFDLHGFVGVRLLGATPADAATVERQLGPLRARLEREPDITVRFVDEVVPSGPLTFAGLHQAGFDRDSFYLLPDAGNRRAKARIPLEHVGDDRCEIVCERHAGEVPLLIAIVNMTALRHGLLPLHASAFHHRGRGVLATGWAKGGKTEALLAFATQGAAYVGDEWVYLGPDGTMYGVPEPIRLWHWQIEQLPHVRRRLTRRQRLRLDVLHYLARLVERAAGARRAPAAGVLRRLAPVLRRQVSVQVPPVRLFGRDAIALRGRLDHVVLVASHDDPRILLEPVPGAEVGRRMLASLRDERAVLSSYYDQFRFAFPDRRSTVLERAGEIEADLVTAALSGRACHWLRHPYPVHIDRLVEPIERILGGPVAAVTSPGTARPAPDDELTRTS